MNFIASILGSEETIFIFPDDNAIVKLGIFAAKLQTAMVMHLFYRVRLTNHDYTVASMHFLIPSVMPFFRLIIKFSVKPPLFLVRAQQQYTSDLVSTTGAMRWFVGGRESQGTHI